MSRSHLTLRGSLVLDLPKSWPDSGGLAEPESPRPRALPARLLCPPMTAAASAVMCRCSDARWRPERQSARCGEAEGAQSVPKKPRSQVSHSQMTFEKQPATIWPLQACPPCCAHRAPQSFAFPGLPTRPSSVDSTVGHHGELPARVCAPRSILGSPATRPAPGTRPPGCPPGCASPRIAAVAPAAPAADRLPRCRRCRRRWSRRRTPLTSRRPGSRMPATPSSATASTYARPL